MVNPLSDWIEVSVTRTTEGGRGGSRALDAGVDELVTAVLTASRVLVGVSARSLAEVEETVTLTQFRTLVVLESRGEIKLNALADALGVNSSTALRMIDRLLVARLVTRRENPDSRREVLLGLTAEGRRIVEVVTAHRRSEITRIVTKMPEARRSQLVRALTVFADAAGEPPSAPAIGGLGW
jgi:DNA-binding MarR family transcriptional regulator